MARSAIHHGGQLNFLAGPLVWIDCEMTGLNPKHDKLLEIAVSRCFYNVKTFSKQVYELCVYRR